MATAGAAYFDGTNDRLNLAPTGLSNSKLFTFSGWMNADDTNERVIVSSNNARYFLIEYKSSQYQWLFKDSGTFNVVGGTTNVGGGISAGSWHHLFLSFDVANTSNRYAYVDGADASPGWSTYDTARTPYFIQSAHYLGAYGQNLGIIKWSGGLSQIWYWPGVYLDAPTYIDKFYSGGSAVPLGSTGETPTGSQPPFCFQSDWDSFQTNDGSEADGTVTGAFTSIVGPTILAAGGGSAGCTRTYIARRRK